MHSSIVLNFNIHIFWKIYNFLTISAKIDLQFSEYSCICIYEYSYQYFDLKYYKYVDPTWNGTNGGIQLWGGSLNASYYEGSLVEYNSNPYLYGYFWQSSSICPVNFTTIDAQVACNSLCASKGIIDCYFRLKNVVIAF